VVLDWIFVGRHDTQYNDIQPNDTQHNATQPNDSQHNATQDNVTQHNATQHNATKPIGQALLRYSALRHSA
jgi:hypothetical protein